MREEKITVMEQYRKDKSKIDSNDRRQIEWLEEFNREHSYGEFD